MSPLPTRRRSPAALTLLAVLAVAVLASTLPVQAQLVPAGGPYRLDAGDLPATGPARVLTAPDGGWLALWPAGEGADASVRGRRFSAAGPNGPGIRFAATTLGEVAFAADGTLLLTDGDVVRRFAADGAPAGEPVAYDDGFSEPWGERTVPYGAHPRAAVAATAEGGFVVAWVASMKPKDESFWYSLGELLVRPFDAAGAPLAPSRPVTGPYFALGDIHLATAADGSYLLTATAQQSVASDFDDGLRLLLHADGTVAALPSARRVWDLRAACTEAGHSLTVFTQTGWDWQSDDGSCSAAFGLPADAAGDLGSEPVDLPRDVRDCQWNSRVALLGDGFVAAWQTGRPEWWWPPPDRNPFHGVSLRRFDLQGRPVGDPLDLRLGAVPADDAVPLLDDLATSGDLVAVVYAYQGGVYARLAAAVPPGPCRPGPDHLCLGGAAGDRFRLDAAFVNPYANDAPGRGRPAPLTADTGAFWFFRPDNLELLVKVLDGRPVNGRHWVLAGAATTTEWWVTVTDTANGEQWGRAVPPYLPASLADVRAFPRPPAAGVPAPAVPPSPGLPGTGDEVLLGGRYRLRVHWRDPRSGDEGEGQGAAVTPDSALFWFFRPSNLELMVKVLDGHPVNGHAWVLWASLTDVAFDLEVEDTQTDAVWRTSNEAYHLGGGADTTALP